MYLRFLDLKLTQQEGEHDCTGNQLLLSASEVKVVREKCATTNLLNQHNT